MAVMNDLGFPFTSISGDRQYSSSEWREYFNALVEGGIVGGVGNELEVKPQAVPNKTIFIDTGSILIEGAMRSIETTVDLSFADNISGSTRIDRVIARINYNDRKIEFVVKEGTPSASPTPPSLVRDSAVYELSLAQVYLANGYSNITGADIIDERSDEDLCGYFRYRAKPAWYPGGDVPIDAWMYTNFPDELTAQEKADIEANPSLMAIINGDTLTTHKADIATQERHGLRLDADGVFQVKYENEWIDAYKLTPEDTSGSPGYNRLIADDTQAGYFGTVSASELWTGEELANEVGISQGSVQNNTTLWLKFIIDGRIIFRPMKPIRIGISWDAINTAGCVFGETTISKNGLDYKVRLMKSGLSDPVNTTANDKGTHGSEYNRLILPVHEKAQTNDWHSPQYVDSDLPNWNIGLSDEDLVTSDTFGDGSYVWCQETLDSGADRRVVRGRYDAAHWTYDTVTTSMARNGWIPVLELI